MHKTLLLIPALCRTRVTYILHIWLLSPTLMTKRIALFVRLESHPSSSYWSVALVSVLDFQTYYFKVLQPPKLPESLRTIQRTAFDGARCFWFDVNFHPEMAAKHLAKPVGVDNHARNVTIWRQLR